ncbi:TetR/AcrR family transcriptional regulator [Solimonas sp. K1W22B-7]|uniref:TetR/AcrR family transcriptional regulator n=1 Tax=Solimonas sp. K1W22B-7 TaxID=2303331 RepID=UPI000E333DA7|nr:TetR/AcrR family transcriptional regulator [Solimonas sp. K1W22B-7]AXQ28567.1 TetR/AcrR family transcriptional regulator [Solimonas sp. K1W22B-7]
MAYQRSALMQERLAENRQRILLSARKLVAEGGFRLASITAVAEAAGLSTGAIYRYFPSKAALFVEVLNSAVAHECEILDAIVDGQGNATLRLRAAVESFARRALKGPSLAYAFIAEPADPEVEAARLLCRRQFGDVFKRVLREGVASGEFPRQSVDVSAACIVGAFTEALVRPVEPATPRKAGEAVVRGIVDFCERAVTGSR